MGQARVDLGLAEKPLDAVSVLFEAGRKQLQDFPAAGDFVLDLIDHGRACRVQYAQKAISAHRVADAESHKEVQTSP